MIIRFGCFYFLNDSQSQENATVIIQGNINQKCLKQKINPKIILTKKNEITSLILRIPNTGNQTIRPGTKLNERA